MWAPGLSSLHGQGATCPGPRPAAPVPTPNREAASCHSRPGLRVGLVCGRRTRPGPGSKRCFPRELGAASSSVPRPRSRRGMAATPLSFHPASSLSRGLSPDSVTRAGVCLGYRTTARVARGSFDPTGNLRSTTMDSLERRRRQITGEGKAGGGETETFFSLHIKRENRRFPGT